MEKLVQDKQWNRIPTWVPGKAYNSSVRELRQDFQCIHTMGMLVPSLHRESANSLVIDDLSKYKATR